MDMEIVCLIENHSDDDRLESEHGLSLFIDTGEEKILFDTGASGKALDNARILGVDLEKVDLTIISHGHYDHGGGLEAFLNLNKKAQVYMCHGADKKHLRVDANSSNYIGLDEEVLEEHSPRIHFVEGTLQLAKNLHLLTSIKQTHTLPAGNQLLFEISDSNLVQDKFSHELVMVLEKENGLVVFTGCSHNGILNILDTVVEQFPNKPILAVFGGLHTMIPPEDLVVDSVQLEMIATNLLDYPLGRIYTGHCTGIKGYQFLKRIMGDEIEYFATGSRITI